MNAASELQRITATLDTVLPPTLPRNPFMPDTEAVDRIAPELENESTRYFERLKPLIDALTAGVTACNANERVAMESAIFALAEVVRREDLTKSVLELRDIDRWQRVRPHEGAAGYGICNALSCDPCFLRSALDNIPADASTGEVLRGIGQQLLNTRRSVIVAPFAARLRELTEPCSEITRTDLENRLSDRARSACHDWLHTDNFHFIVLRARVPAHSVEDQPEKSAITGAGASPKTLKQLQNELRILESEESYEGPYAKNGTGHEEFIEASNAATANAAFRLEIESAHGYDDLRALVIGKFDGDISAAMCGVILRALVKQNVKPIDADRLTLTEVVARLRPGTTPPPPPSTTSGQGKRPRPSVTLAALQYQHGLASLKRESPGKTSFTDREVYDDRKANECDLPCAESWLRHIRSARKEKLLEAKNQPRTPYSGRSAVPASHRG